jgi:hypothetical protein
MAHRLIRGGRFAKAVDWHSGTMRAEGLLTMQGAHLVRGVACVEKRGEPRFRKIAALPVRNAGRPAGRH